MKRKGNIILVILLAVVGVLIIFGGFLIYKNATESGGAIVGNKYSDLIQIDSPIAGAVTQSPLVVTGKARGPWYFEASFPIKLFDANGTELAAIPVQAQGDWMTENFVPFKATLIFANPTTKTGTLILKNDNPSGLPENEKEVRIPVQFSDYKEIKSAEFNKPIILSIKGKVVFPDGLSLSLSEINDSRCKAGVVCIWAGELSAVFAATEGKFATSSEEVRLGTINNNSVSSGGYTFSLLGAAENSATISVYPVPAVGGSGTVIGYLHLGPTCPVERIPPDPNCAEKAYADAKVDITLKTSGVLVKSLISDATGSFRANLAPGTYTITAGPKAGGFLPRCNETEVTATAGKATSVDISCDTGIR